MAESGRLESQAAGVDGFRPDGELREVGLQPGKMLSHRRLDGKIGEEGMGEAWKETDTTRNQPVAIKILPEAFANDPRRGLLVVQNWFEEFRKR